MTTGSTEPRFLSPAGEQAWVRIRRHLDRANRFWLAFVLTENTLTADILRERVQGNRRLRAERFVELRPQTPAEFTAMVDSFEQRAAAPAGCTMVLAPLTPAAEWLDVWRRLLYLLNHRRDTLRRRLGGVLLVAPPAVKAIAQRETTDLWSVVDLLVELPSVPSARPSGLPDRQAELHRGPPASADISVGGLYLGEAPEHLLSEGIALLALPRAELATTARARTTTAIHNAHDNGANQLAAVLLLAQADGYQATGDRAAALDLVRSALRMDGIDIPTRIRLVDSAAELAMVMGDLTVAAEDASESVELAQSRAGQLGTPEALRDLSISLEKLADIDRARGELDAARAGYLRGLELRERLAGQLGTPEALRDLSISLERLADIDGARGELDAARAGYLRGLELRERLAGQLGTPEALRDLSVSLNRLADIDRARGELDAARAGYLRGLELRERLAGQLGTPGAFDDLGWSLERLADVVTELGDADHAAELRLRAVQARKQAATGVRRPSD